MSASRVLTATPTNSIRLVAARAGWLVLALLIVALILAGLPQRAGDVANAFRGLDALSGLSPAFVASLAVAVELLAVLFHLTVAALLVWRRPFDRMAVFVAVALSANGALIPLNLTYLTVQPPEPGRAALSLVVYIGLVSSIGLLYLFPDGKFVPRSTRILVAAWAILLLPDFFLQGVPFSLRSWPVGLQLAILLFFSGAGIAAQFQRYRHFSTATERQQTKWAILGLTAAVVGPLSYFLPFVILPAAAEAVPNLLIQRMGGAFFTLPSFRILLAALLIHLIPFLFPVSFAFSILRYRLWDIDLIIRRTLLYSTLTGLLLFIYLVSIVLTQAIFRQLFGAGSAPAVVVSTLLIAALFTPSRQRVQNALDRRFYRSKVDARLALAGFARAARDEVELEALLIAVASVVHETMQPDVVGVWLDRSKTPEAERRQQRE